MESGVGEEGYMRTRIEITDTEKDKLYHTVPVRKCSDISTLPTLKAINKYHGCQYHDVISLTTPYLFITV